MFDPLDQGSYSENTWKTIHSLIGSCIYTYSVVYPPVLSSSKTFFITLQESLYPLSCCSLFLLLPSPWRQPICILSLWSYLLWIVHLNGIIQYVKFYIWFFSRSLMFLRFIHLVACMYRYFIHSFLYQNDISLCAYMAFCLAIYLLMGIWAVSII